MLSHIAYMIGRDADDEVNRDDLRAWLKVYPWLVILDGLDEVPASGERSAVIEAINGFLSEIAGAGADAMVIVTSRPQGYNNDLDERYWARWQLADLDSELAVKYAEALSLAQYPLDRDRRNRTLSALKRAMEHPATARLMVSPLQVTILHIIIDGGGSAPVGRWALFNEYFQILKKREKSKGGPIQAVLEKNWDHIDPVHYQAGLVLQTESEAAGAAGAHFTLKRLKSLIKAFLRSIDYSKHETELRADELGNLAVNRLVLMSMRQQGRTEAEGLITFDVRSLQEFMAAAELTTETERAPTLGDSDNSSKIEERLIQICGAAHWHHCFLIAASRCFSETALYHLRSVLVAIPRTLDTNVSYRLSRMGARLALDLLADGIGINHPISRKKLVVHALDLLELGPSNLDERLVSIWQPETADIYEERLRHWLSSGSKISSAAAWKLLLLLCKDKSERFLPIAENNWPSMADEVLDILTAMINRYGARQFVLPTPSFWEKAFFSMVKIEAPKVLDSFHPYMERNELPKCDAERLFRDIFSGDAEWISAPFPNDLQDAQFSLAIHIRSIRTKHAVLACTDTSGWHPSWLAFAASARFLQNPCREGLASCLREIASGNTFETAKRLGGYFLSWPVSSLLNFASNTEELISLSDRAAAGDFGDHDSWEIAEERWSRNGISSADLQIQGSNGPFGRDIGRIGAPFP